MSEPSPRLILFDVDGTLILSQGVAGRLMLKAVETAAGKDDPFEYDVRDFAGFTDRAIMRKLLQRAGVPPEELEEKLRYAERLYLSWIAERFKNPHFVKVLPGVLELLESLRKTSGFYLGLLTGNLREGARIKLSSVGLWEYFPIGAFGDDAEDRNLLPPVALKRAREYYGIEFPPHHTWIIGDAPNDVRCARANHIRCLAVATGVIPAKELQNEHPDVLLPDLQDTETVKRILREDS